MDQGKLQDGRDEHAIDFVVNDAFAVSLLDAKLVSCLGRDHQGDVQGERVTSLMTGVNNCVLDAAIGVGLWTVITTAVVPGVFRHRLNSGSLLCC